MRRNLTEIVFILDRSGSMSGLEADTIGGFNSMIEKQKRENGEALISTVLFDNVSEVIHDRVPVQRVEPMTDKGYSVRGCTALLDAIGGAIHHIGNVHTPYTFPIITEQCNEYSLSGNTSRFSQRLIQKGFFCLIPA